MGGLEGDAAKWYKEAAEVFRDPLQFVVRDGC